MLFLHSYKNNFLCFFLIITMCILNIVSSIKKITVQERKKLYPWKLLSPKGIFEKKYLLFNEISEKNDLQLCTTKLNTLKVYLIHVMLKNTINHF